MVYSFLFLTVAFLYFLFAVWVFLRDPRGTLNRLFGLVGLVLGVWAAGEAVIQTLGSSEEIWIWYRACAMGWIVTPALLLHFDLELGERRRILSRSWAVVLLYLPAVVFYVRLWTGPLMVNGFARVPGGWAERTPGSLPWSLAYELYYLAYVLSGLAIVYAWGRKATLRAQRLQSAVIVYVGVVSMVLATISNVVLPSLHFYPTAPLAPIAILPWAIGIGYATARLKLMTLSVETASADILRTMGDGVILLDWNRRVLLANAVATRLLGYAQERLVGSVITDILPHYSVVKELAPEHLPPGQVVSNVEIEYVSPSARPATISISASAVVDRFGDSIGIVLVLHDISDLKVAREKLQFMATHDPLTGLPNRFLLNDRLRVAIANAQRHGHLLAVMLLDLDNFKTTNDTLGHSVGDQLLRLIAERASQCLRANDTFGRMGGDEFVVVLSEIESPSDAAFVAQRIFASVAGPLHVESHELYPSASLGISIYPNDGDSVEQLMRNADMAMYSAKEAGKNGYRFFSESMTEENYEQLLSEKALRLALSEGQFAVYYQPICDLDSGSIAVAEALLRWRHPQRGMLTASSFIPAAERTGLIVPISEWVLREVCAQKAQWISSGAKDLAISVNISPKHFQREDFLERIIAIIDESGVPPAGLIFELTESAAIRDIDRSRKVMGRLTEMGIRIMIDDFGTGYSSLSWLKTVPAYAIKIDKFFVQNIEGDTDNLTILRAIIAMAHSLNLQVIAEGIETREQAERLRSMDWRDLPSARCNFGQGFFYADPAPAEELTRFLTRRPSN